MKGLLVVLLSCIFVVNGLNGIAYDDLLDTGFINTFDQCSVIRTLNDPILGINQAQVMLCWKFTGAANDSLNIGIAAKVKTEGYIGFGPNKINNKDTTSDLRMYFTDAVIGFTKNGAADVDDYFVDGNNANQNDLFVFCNNKKGLCPDTTVGGTKSVTNGNYAFNTTSTVAHLTYTRTLAATDVTPAVDVAILNQEQMFCYVFSDSSGITGGQLNYHSSNRDVVYTNLFLPANCPKGANNQVCSGNGACTKGLCICTGNFTNFDCAADINKLNQGGGAGGISANIVESDFPANLQFSPNPQVKYFWKIDQAAKTIDVAMRCTGCGWVAFGVGDDDFMPSTDAYLGWVDGTTNPPTVIVSDYKILTDRNSICPGLCPDNDPQVGGTSDVLAFNGNQKGDVTELLFRRKLVTGDVKGDFDIAPGQIFALWAFGLVDGPALDYHGVQNRGSAKIDFFNGGADIKNVEPLRLAHGSLMFIIWAVLIPFTSFLARYWKRFPWWFNVHRGVNAIAMLLGLISFILAIFIVGSHFDTAHKILGLLVTIIGTVQPFIGILADCLFDPARTSSPMVPDRLHWVLGWGSMLMGLVNIALGLLAYQFILGAIHFVYFAFAILLVIFLLTFFIINLVTGFPGGGH